MLPVSTKKGVYTLFTTCLSSELSLLIYVDTVVFAFLRELLLNTPIVCKDAAHGDGQNLDLAEDDTEI